MPICLAFSIVGALKVVRARKSSAQDSLIASAVIRGMLDEVHVGAKRYARFLSPG